MVPAGLRRGGILDRGPDARKLGTPTVAVVATIGKAVDLAVGSSGAGAGVVVEPTSGSRAKE